MSEVENLRMTEPGGVEAWRLLFAAWIVSLTASLGALFIGEVMGQAPCALCWRQQTFMLPLAIILAVACYRSDAQAWRYALPIAAVGWLFAAYHALLYAGVISEAFAPCSANGPSCASADMTILGAIPIPFLSLAAFTLIALCLTRIAWRPAT